VNNGPVAFETTSLGKEIEELFFEINGFTVCCFKFNQAETFFCSVPRVS
jgi:hypothetical protein